jgi:hypothetical protein
MPEFFGVASNSEPIGKRRFLAKAQSRKDEEGPHFFVAPADVQK